MITIQICKEENRYRRILLSGHAGYEEYGKDIVCSGVSAIVTTSVNAILRFDKTALVITEKKGFLDLEIQKQDPITVTLLENMVSLLEEVKQKYPGYIQFK